jgi:hypothetical protein
MRKNNTMKTYQGKKREYWWQGSGQPTYYPTNQPNPRLSNAWSEIVWMV